MTSNDIHGIESGWSVRTADDADIGSVEEATERYILVKSGLIGGERRYLPAATLEHVRPELKRIELSISKDELDAGDWTEPPAEGPRLEGAPVNPDVRSADQPHAETARRALEETHAD